MTERESKIESLLADLLEAAQQLVECQDEEDIGNVPVEELAAILYERTNNYSHSDAIDLLKKLMASYAEYEKGMDTFLDNYERS